MAERYDAVVIGAGPGGEVAVARLLAQMLRRFGAQVTLVEAANRLLSREDPAVRS